MADRNPVADVKPGDVLKARRQINFARIELENLPELLRKVTAYDGSIYTRVALQLMLLTFVRTGKLIGARWKEIDFAKAEWRIPDERTKSRREHQVLLCRQAIIIEVSASRAG